MERDTNKFTGWTDVSIRSKANEIETPASRDLKKNVRVAVDCTAAVAVLGLAVGALCLIHKRK